jgi:predicted MFS family arabinose efflux permease
VLFACSHSVLGLSAGRFLIGVGHGGTIAGIYMLALSWVSSDRVATTTGGMIAIAGGIGGVLATVPLVLALEALGHQRTFLAVAAATAVLTVAIGLFVRDAPDGHVAATGRGETLVQSVRGLWAVLVERKLWPVFAMGACFTAPFAVVGGLWAGPYLVDVHGLGREQASFAVMAMVAAFHLGNLGYGPLERVLGTRKWTVVSGVLALIALLAVLAAWPGMAAGATVALLVLYCLCTPFYPVLAAHCRAFVPLGRAGRAISVVNLTGLITAFALQKLTGTMVDLTRAADGTTTELGYRLVFMTLAVTLLTALSGYLRVRDVPP